MNATIMITIGWGMVLIAYAMLYWENRGLKKRIAEMEKQTRLIRGVESGGWLFSMKSPEHRN